MVNNDSKQNKFQYYQNCVHALKNELHSKSLMLNLLKKLESLTEIETLMKRNIKLLEVKQALIKQIYDKKCTNLDHCLSNCNQNVCHKQDQDIIKNIEKSITSSNYEEQVQNINIAEFSDCQNPTPVKINEGEKFNNDCKLFFDYVLPEAEKLNSIVSSQFKDDLLDQVFTQYESPFITTENDLTLENNTKMYTNSHVSHLYGNAQYNCCVINKLQYNSTQITDNLTTKYTDQSNSISIYSIKEIPMDNHDKKECSCHKNLMSCACFCTYCSCKSCQHNLQREEEVSISKKRSQTNLSIPYVCPKCGSKVNKRIMSDDSKLKQDHKSVQCPSVKLKTNSSHMCVANATDSRILLGRKFLKPSVNRHTMKPRSINGEATKLNGEMSGIDISCVVADTNRSKRSPDVENYEDELWESKQKSLSAYVDRKMSSDRFIRILLSPKSTNKNLSKNVSLEVKKSSYFNSNNAGSVITKFEGDTNENTTRERVMEDIVWLRIIEKLVQFTILEYHNCPCQSVLTDAMAPANVSKSFADEFYKNIDDIVKLLLVVRNMYDGKTDEEK